MNNKFIYKKKELKDNYIYSNKIKMKIIIHIIN